MCLVIGTRVVVVLVLFEHAEQLDAAADARAARRLLPRAGSTALLFDPSFQRVIEHIRLGTPTTIYLVKPVNAQFLLTSGSQVRVLSLVTLTLWFVANRLKSCTGVSA